MIGRLLREPLVHFLLLGVALFAAYTSMERGRGGGESSQQIRLTLDDLRQLDLHFASQWRRPPTPEELNRLVESKVQEEVLYREALALGLDKDDTIVMGLLLIVQDRWMLLKAVTSFTLAHSFTLAVATLGYASAPMLPLNAAIALSILFLGPEIVRSGRGRAA